MKTSTLNTSTQRKPAIIVVDYQHDFASINGSFSVPGGEVIGKTIKNLVDLFLDNGRDVFFSGDLHTPGHSSFASTHGVAPFEFFEGQQKWPDHCIIHTPGAELFAPFTSDQYNINIKKGFVHENDSLSAFGGKTLDETKTFNEVLTEKGITDLYVTGLAAEYCVADTAEDGAKNGYNTHFITDATAGVTADATEQKKEYLKNLGVVILASHEAIETLKNIQ